MSTPTGAARAPANPMTLLVTGGVGYVGIHTCAELVAAGHNVVILDNLEHGERRWAEHILGCPLVVANIADRGVVGQTCADHGVDAVIHFAAYAYVGESTSDPGKYWRNNVLGTLELVEAITSAGVDKLVFSSSCATYGVPDSVPILEDAMQRPINPYGETKLACEKLLHDFEAPTGLRSMALRYFNAAGADPEGRFGETHDPETHLIPLILAAAAGDRDAITVFGTDYPTADGTCIRDYVHVSDLAVAHRLAVERLAAGGASTRLNLSTGRGYSVNETIAAVERVTGRTVPVVYGDRRDGDPPELVGAPQNAQTELGWVARHSDIDSIVTHAWDWYVRHHGSKRR